MKASDVLQVLGVLRESGIQVYVAGGWGIDALVREQSRPHADLDLAFDASNEDRLLVVMRRDGFLMTTDERPARFVLQDPNGRQIDFHPVAFDAAGHGVQVAGGGVTYHYPSTGFARGIIGGVEMDCLSPELLIQFHLGYTPTEKDIRDMQLLRDRLGVQLPTPYS